MSKFLVDISDEQRAKLEAHRKAFGLRSLSDALRDLIDNRASAPVMMQRGLPGPERVAEIKAADQRRREGVAVSKTLGDAIKDGDVVITKITAADTPAAQAAAKSFKDALANIGPVRPKPGSLLKVKK